MLELIKDHAQKTGNHCGLSIVSLSNMTGLTVNVVREHLKALYSERKIVVKEGINHKLIFDNGNK